MVIDFRNLNTSSVRYTHKMFYDCHNLQTLDLSNFNTSKVKFMACMFRRCTSLKTIKLPKDAMSRQKLITQIKEDGIQCTII